MAVIDLNSGGVDCDLYYCGDIARVNSIAPGWIDTEREEGSREDREQHPVKRVGRPEDIAKMAMYLCSEDSSFITGENITIDGGMTKQMIYHNDLGWSYQ